MGLHHQARVPLTSSSRYRDYSLLPYEPRGATEGKLHSVSMFRHLLREHDMLDTVWPICERLRAHLGEDETVWGFKFAPKGVCLELYFYNWAFYGPGFMPDPTKNPKSIAVLRRVLEPELRFGSELEEAKPYFMCSFELDPTTVRQKDGGYFRIYVSSGDKARQDCGFSFRVEEEQRLVLENHYWFYKPAKRGDLGDARRRLMLSPRAGAETCWSVLMPDYLQDCFSICYSVKPRSDGLYFSRITTAQLVRFLREHRPGAMCETLALHEDDFAPILWDLGIDFLASSPSAASIQIEKLAVYGIL